VGIVVDNIERVYATEENIKDLIKLFKLEVVGVSNINGGVICHTTNDFKSNLWSQYSKYIEYEIISNQGRIQEKMTYLNISYFNHRILNLNMIRKMKLERIL
jgi:hypothetical protein